MAPFAGAGPCQIYVHDYSKEWGGLVARNKRKNMSCIEPLLLCWERTEISKRLNLFSGYIFTYFHFPALKVKNTNSV